MSLDAENAVDQLRSELAEINETGRVILEKWQTSTQDLAAAQRKIIELTSLVESLRQQNSGLRRSLIRTRRTMFPGSDQDAVINRDFPPL